MSENNQIKNPEGNKSEVIETIDSLNKKIKMHLGQCYIGLYYALLLLSVIGFLWLIFIVFSADTPQPKQHCCCFCSKSMPELVAFRWIMVLKMFVILLLSLVFVWWVKFLGKLISNCREAMKPWQKKVTDTYAFLLEMETMLYKATCEKKKKVIEKPDDQEVTEDVENAIFEKKLKEIREKELENKTIVEQQWVVRLKDDNNNPS